MKVKVRFAQPTILVKREVYEAEFEKLFQENKDLRLAESHLRDDLACAEREIAYWKSKTEEATAELVKCDVGHYQREIDELQATADQLAEKCQKFQDERDKAWTALRELQTVESQLDYYRDIAAHRKERNNQLETELAELREEHQELGEDYDALVQTKREYAECIDTLRQENKRLRNQMPLPEFMRQFIEMTREAVQNEFPDSGNS